MQWKEPHLSYFHYICEMDNHEAIKKALQCNEMERNAKINSVVSDDDTEESAIIGFTALHFAAQNGNVCTITLLLEYGANINAMAWIGTPIFVSVFFNKSEAFDLLLQNGADLNVLLSDNSNVFQSIFEYIDDDDILFYWMNKIVNANCCNINQQNGNGNTPLHLVPKVAIQYLLDCGADLNITNKNGQTAFNYIASQDFPFGNFFYLCACKHIIKLDLINFPISNQNKIFF